jgi:hypothetical protein
LNLAGGSWEISGFKKHIVPFILSILLLKEEYEKYTDDHEKKRKAFHTLIADNLAGDALNAFDKIWVS